MSWAAHESGWWPYSLDVWFRALTGFDETNGDVVRAQLRLDGDRLTSLVNGRTMGVGTLTTPSLAELRDRAHDTGPGTVDEIEADVADLHADPRNAGAVFQVASQFNLLEMPSPDVTPEAGVSGYEHDHTQGPACAMACAGGTIHRNWFVAIGDQMGQSASTQIDCLADLGRALHNDANALWTMTNGYCLATAPGLSRIRAVLDSASTGERDYLAGLLRIGQQMGVEVTRHNAGHAVTQLYCAALPVAYGEPPPDRWEPFARLVLEASYEATLRAAHLNAATTGNPTLFLTRLGGGVFGNDAGWIDDAIHRAVDLVGAGLDVQLVNRPS